MNIVERKSLVLKPCLKVPNCMLSHYIRGYYDRDGHILNISNNEQKAIGFSGNFEFLDWIKMIIKNNCNVGNPKILPDKNISCLRFTGNKQAPIIAKWLYEGSTEDTRLDRKYHIAKEKYGVN